MFKKTIDLCARAQKPSEAIGVLDELLELGIKPTCLTFDRVIVASAKKGNRKSTLSILDLKVIIEGIPKVVSTSIATTSACRKASQSEKALELFNSMEGRGATPNVNSYSAAISACEKCGQ